MNTLPDASFKELANEQALTDASCPPHDSELGADWQLKQELRSLKAPTFPAGLHEQVLARTHQRQNPAWWMGLAAAIILALAVGLFHQLPQQGAEPVAISTSDLEQLQLALATLDDSVRLTGSLAGRELADNRIWPEMRIEQLPHGSTLMHWLQPRSIPET